MRLNILFILLPAVILGIQAAEYSDKGTHRTLSNQNSTGDLLYSSLVFIYLAGVSDSNLAQQRNTTTATTTTSSSSYSSFYGTTRVPQLSKLASLVNSADPTLSGTSFFRRIPTIRPTANRLKLKHKAYIFEALLGLPTNEFTETTSTEILSLFNGTYKNLNISTEFLNAIQPKPQNSSSSKHPINLIKQLESAFNASQTSAMLFSSSFEKVEYQFGQNSLEFHEVTSELDASLIEIYKRIDNSTLLMIVGMPPIHNSIAVKQAEFFINPSDTYQPAGNGFMLCLTKQGFSKNPLDNSNSVPSSNMNISSIGSTLANVIPEFPFPPNNLGMNLLDIYPKKYTQNLEMIMLNNTLTTLESMLASIKRATLVSSQSDIVKFEQVLEEQKVRFHNLLDQSTGQSEDQNQKQIIELLSEIRIQQSALLEISTAEKFQFKTSFVIRLCASIVILATSSLLLSRYFPKQYSTTPPNDITPQAINNNSPIVLTPTQSEECEQQTSENPTNPTSVFYRTPIIRNLVITKSQKHVFLPISIVLLIVLLAFSNKSMMISFYRIVADTPSDPIPKEECIPTETKALIFKNGKCQLDVVSWYHGAFENKDTFENPSKYLSSILELLFIWIPIIFCLEWAIHSTSTSESPQPTTTTVHKSTQKNRTYIYIALIVFCLCYSSNSPSTFSGTFGFIAGPLLRYKFGLFTHLHKFTSPHALLSIFFLLLAAIRQASFSLLSPIIDSVLCAIVILFANPRKSQHKITFFLLMVIQYGFNFMFDGLEISTSSMYSHLIFSAGISSITLIQDMYSHARIAISFIQIIAINLLMAVFAALLVRYQEIEMEVNATPILLLFYIPCFWILVCHNSMKVEENQEQSKNNTSVRNSPISLLVIPSPPVRLEQSQSQINGQETLKTESISENNSSMHPIKEMKIDDKLPILSLANKQKRFKEVVHSHICKSLSFLEFFSITSVFFTSILVTLQSILLMCFNFNLQNHIFISSYQEATLDSYLIIQSTVSFVLYGLSFLWVKRRQIRKEKRDNVEQSRTQIIVKVNS